ncbi:sec-independent protein translocase protein TatA [Prauserella shujinwangii]|uniref:Sec-independent protein translocase protein TatA n=1 Tax=Prauserella shujinwangii TaxID=1453103 RepID=A0A2T0LP87_9PSEU|nr:Sec-independent protein translocase subunit TatA [Prauserella shujinwangii]PRX45057.1 sec-independent protein translocase protein TatA [Prauserella shujinwangii]
MNALQPWHLIILVLVVVLLFGAKRLPDAARSIGKSMKIFKAETKDMRGSDDADKPAEEAETRQLPQSSQPDKDQQVAELQRQLDELKKQQQAAPADQAQKNAS